MYGLAFGVLATQAEMDGIQVGVMGTLVFAGASQIVAVERLIAEAGAWVALGAGLALNLRLVLITASIRDVFAGRPRWQRLLGGHLSTDENWALLLAKRADGGTAGFHYLVGAGAAVLAAWTTSTVAGVYLANLVPEPRSIGLDFTFTAAFIAIARSLWTGRADLTPWITSAAIAGAATVVLNWDASWALLAGGITGSLAAGIASDD